MTDEVEMRTLEIATNEQVFRITIPATWKTTFGAIVPGAKASTGYQGGWGLRIWEAQDKQRAVFTNVIAFKDVAIPMQIKAVRKYGGTEWWSDDGTWTGARALLVEKGWVHEDEIMDMPPEEGDEPAAKDEWGDPTPALLRKRR